MPKARSKAAYMISAVAEQYELHPQTLRLYEREGLLKPSRSEGNTRLYTDGDLERLEVILHLTRDLGVNLAGVEIILNMREKMGEMQSQIQEFIASLNRELAARTARPPQAESNYLIPVVNARPPVPAPRRARSGCARSCTIMEFGPAPFHARQRSVPSKRHSRIHRAIRRLRGAHGGGTRARLACGMVLSDPVYGGAGPARIRFAAGHSPAHFGLFGQRRYRNRRIPDLDRARRSVWGRLPPLLAVSQCGEGNGGEFGAGGPETQLGVHCHAHPRLHGAGSGCGRTVLARLADALARQ